MGSAGASFQPSLHNSACPSGTPSPPDLPRAGGRLGSRTVKPSTGPRTPPRKPQLCLVPGAGRPRWALLEVVPPGQHRLGWLKQLEMRPLLSMSTLGPLRACVRVPLPGCRG